MSQRLRTQNGVQTKLKEVITNDWGYSVNLASYFRQFSSLITAQKEAITAEADDSNTKQSATWHMTCHPSKDDTTP